MDVDVVHCRGSLTYVRVAIAMKKVTDVDFEIFSYL